ncbi:MAG: acyl dehydratase [Deltaproteobacteria bacterium]|nr:MAG: acyl dehydratase [Deltaproteobacteria bacterium]
MESRYFEDIKEGEVLNCAPVKFTREEILEFGRRFDPQPFHVNEDSANASIFKGLVASSLHTLSACTKVVVEALDGAVILTGVGIEEAILYHPVRPGDLLTVNAHWTDMRRSKTRPGNGFATVRCEVSNQEGALVMRHGYNYMLACRKK